MIKYTCVPSLNKTAAKCLMLLGLLMAGGQSAYAACYVNNGYKAQVINMNLGRVLVTPSSQVGDTLVTAQFTINPVSRYGSCTNGGNAIGEILGAARRASAMCGVPIFRVSGFVYTEKRGV